MAEAKDMAGHLDPLQCEDEGRTRVGVCSPWSGSIHISGELIRNAESWAPPLVP